MLLVGDRNPTNKVLSLMAMHLSDLKRKPVAELIDTAREMGLENVGRSRKQRSLPLSSASSPKMARIFTARAH